MTNYIKIHDTTGLTTFAATGLTDVQGGVYSMGSSGTNPNAILGTCEGSNSYGRDFAVWTDNLLSGQIVSTSTDAVKTGQEVWINVLHYNPVTKNCYFVLFANGSYFIGSLTGVSQTVNILSNSPNGTGVVGNHKMRMTTTYTGSGSRIQITSVLYDVTADAAVTNGTLTYDSNTDASASANSNGGALYAAGYQGVDSNQNATGQVVQFDSIQSYRPAVPTMALSSQSVIVNSTGNSISITGTETFWVNGTTQFTLSGGTAASITSSQPVTISGTPGTPGATQTATILLNAGSAAGANLLTIGNNSGDGLTATLSVNNAVASALTITPSSGSGVNGIPSGTFTIAANGAISGTHNLTLSDGAGGTFIPSTGLSLTSGSPTTNFTYTPTSVGTKTITVTDSSGYTSASATYIVSAALTTVFVNDANWYFSEWGWYKSGSSYAGTNAPGNYFKIAFTGTVCYIDWNVSNLRAANITSPNNWPKVRLYVDDLAPVDVQLSDPGSNTLTTTVALNSANNGTYHYIKVQWIGANPNAGDRWNVTSGQIVPPNALAISDVRIDGATRTLAGTPIALLPKRLLAYGDSITEGWNSNANGTYTYYPGSYINALANALSAEYSVLGYSGQTLQWNVAGSGNIPYFPSTFGNHWAGQSRLTSGVFSAGSPDYITINQGTNDAANSQTITSAFVQGVLSNLRTAAPTATIGLIIPYGIRPYNTGTAALNALTNALTTFHTGSETKSFLLDLGISGNAGLNSTGTTTLNSPDGIHILSERASYLGAQTAGNLLNQIGVGAATYTSALNVRLGTDRGDGTLGSMIVPPANKVLAGTTFDATTVGTATVPTAAQVLSGVSYGTGGNALTGVVALPSTSQVLSSVTFGPSNNLTGNVVLPSVSNVRLSTTFGVASGSTGTLAIPLASNVLSGVQYGAGGTEFNGTATSSGGTDVIAQQVVDALMAYSMEIGVSFKDVIQATGAYVGGNTDGTSTFKALGNPGTTRISYTVHPTTKARTVSINNNP